MVHFRWWHRGALTDFHFDSSAALRGTSLIHSLAVVLSWVRLGCSGVRLNGKTSLNLPAVWYSLTAKCEWTQLVQCAFVTNQNAKFRVETVGGVLVAGDLAGVSWKRDAIFIPFVSGWRWAISVVAAQGSWFARRHRRWNFTHRWRWRHCTT